MNILNELVDPNTLILSNTDKAVLASIFSSPTPELAFQNTNGSENLIVSRNRMNRFNLINVNTHQAVITNDGKTALIANNLIDEMDQLTDDGSKLVDSIKIISKPFKESIRPIRDLLV